MSNNLISAVGFDTTVKVHQPSTIDTTKRRVFGVAGSISFGTGLLLASTISKTVSHVMVTCNNTATSQSQYDCLADILELALKVIGTVSLVTAGYFGIAHARKSTPEALVDPFPQQQNGHKTDDYVDSILPIGHVESTPVATPAARRRRPSRALAVTTAPGAIADAIIARRNGQATKA